MIQKMMLFLRILVYCVFLFLILFRKDMSSIVSIPRCPGLDIANDHRTWFVPAGLSSSICTICPECYHCYSDNLLRDVRCFTYKHKPSLASKGISCDFANQLWDNGISVSIVKDLSDLPIGFPATSYPFSSTTSVQDRIERKATAIVPAGSPFAIRIKSFLPEQEVYFTIEECKFGDQLLTLDGGKQKFYQDEAIIPASWPSDAKQNQTVQVSIQLWKHLPRQIRSLRKLGSDRTAFMETITSLRKLGSDRTAFMETKEAAQAFGCDLSGLDLPIHEEPHTFTTEDIYVPLTKHKPRTFHLSILSSEVGPVCQTIERIDEKLRVQDEGLERLRCDLQKQQDSMLEYLKTLREQREKYAAEIEQAKKQ